MNKKLNLISAIVFSVALTLFGVTSITSEIGLEKLVIFQDLGAFGYSPLKAFIDVFGLSLLAIIILIYPIYKVLNNFRKLPNNKDDKKKLFSKQIFNGIALCLFIKISSTHLWPDIYQENVVIWKDLIAGIILVFLLIAVCMVIVSKKKNINEYLQLITYSEIIIAPLLIIGWLYFEKINPQLDMYTYERGLISFAVQDLIRILNIVLPLVFYLKLSKKVSD